MTHTSRSFVTVALALTWAAALAALVTGRGLALPLTIVPLAGFAAAFALAWDWARQGHGRRVAIAAIVVITVVNIGGLSRTVTVTKFLLCMSLAALLVVLVAGWSAPATDIGRLIPIDTTVYGVLQAAGFMFFAFAGYARIATLGEEVKAPTRTIPLAIPLALAAVLLVYLTVAITTLAAVPILSLANSTAPLRDIVDASGVTVLGPVVGWGAGIAALGVLLNLIPAISRTTLAMARNREFPAWFAHVDVARSIPLRAELTVAAVVISLILVIDLREAIAISGVAVLTYYAITNAAALTLRPDQRRWPRAIAITGVIGCITLVAALPAPTVVIGVFTLFIGAGARAIFSRRN